MMNSNNSLQLDDKMNLHRKEWRVQKIGWSILSLLLIAAALGLFGNGVLSETIVGNPGTNHWMRYQHFIRLEAPFTLEVHMTTSENKAAVLAIPNDYLQVMNLEKMTPEPDQIQIKEGQVQYIFPGNGHVQVNLQLKPSAFGRKESTFYLNNQPYAISHFIYP